MIRTEDLRGVTDGNVHGPDGGKIGSVGQIYLDNESGQPAWVTVKTGLFGTKASFVPLAEASVDGRDLRVPYDKETIKHAPNVDADGELSPAEEDELYRYYDVDSGVQGQQGERGESDHSSRSHDTDAVAGGVAGVAQHQPDEHGHGQHHSLQDAEGERHEGQGGRDSDRRGDGEHGEQGVPEHREQGVPEHREQGVPEHLDHGDGEHHEQGVGEHSEHRDEDRGDRGQSGGERRIRRYIVTEETVTRREEEIPSDDPHPR